MPRKSLKEVAPRMFWQTIQCLKRVSQDYAQALRSNCIEVMSSTVDTGEHWKQHFEEPLD